MLSIDERRCRVDDTHKKRPPPKVKATMSGGIGRGVVPHVGAVVVPKRGHPTSYMPGTGGKLGVMKARYARCEPILHPYDARYDKPLLPLVFQALDPSVMAEMVKDLSWSPDDREVEVELGE